MSGHFFAFKNREKISEAKKLSLRETISNKKSNLIKNNSPTNEKNDKHTHFTQNDINKVKRQIRQTIKFRKRKENLFFVISFFLIFILLLFVSKKYNVF